MSALQERCPVAFKAKEVEIPGVLQDNETRAAKDADGDNAEFAERFPRSHRFLRNLAQRKAALMDEIRRRNAPREALAAAGKALMAQDICAAASGGGWLLHSFSSDLERPLPPHLPQPPSHPLHSHVLQPQQPHQTVSAEPLTPAPSSPAQLHARQAALATASSAPAASYAALILGAWGAPGPHQDSPIGVAPLSCPSYSALPVDGGASANDCVRVPHPLIEFAARPSSGGMAPGAAVAMGELSSSAAAEPATNTLLNGLLATVVKRQKSVSTRFQMHSRKVKEQDADGLLDEQLPDLAVALASLVAEAAAREQEQRAAAGGGGGLRRNPSCSRSTGSDDGGGRRSPTARSRSPSCSPSRSPSPGRRLAQRRTQSLRNSSSGMDVPSNGNDADDTGAVAASSSTLAPSASFPAPGACLPGTARPSSTRFGPTPPTSGPPPASTNSASGAPAASAPQPPADLSSFQQTRRQRLQQQLQRPQLSTGGGGPGNADGLAPRSSSSFTRVPASRLVMGGVSQSLDGGVWASAEGAAAAVVALSGEVRPYSSPLQAPWTQGDGLQLPRLTSAGGAASHRTQPAGGVAGVSGAVVDARAAAGGGAASPAWSAPGGAAPTGESSGSGVCGAMSPRLRSSGSRSRFQSPSSSRRLIPTGAATGVSGGGGSNGAPPSSPGGSVPLTRGQSWWAKSTVARELVFLK
ncbi:hypothetical protein CHLRE_06g278235v5 [Chlamydomonas reinhardtii]|uniref:Uncharacterized protein n=1 Tax=Chlamydomonas reinhardtii TaxID=3055 RepID=A0A2K3DP97_CHLRE|nr:uncharacterized protein CHLRE_06g278235v5 [Chlamydomonas reinhardtii]PNW82347.1 hypothetical protein CHLRE_06g278235v5 [Chlamydomonas reinhardtii]